MLHICDSEANNVIQDNGIKWSTPYIISALLSLEQRKALSVVFERTVLF